MTSSDLNGVRNNFMVSIVAIGELKGPVDRVPLRDNYGNFDFGRTERIDKLLARASEHLPADEHFDDDEIPYVNAACASLNFVRPSTNKRELAHALAWSLVRKRKQH